jgi:pilus assembly protein FimV
MARKIAAVVFSMGVAHSYTAYGLGLGELTLNSFLNEPLRAEVDLLNTHGLHPDQIRIRLATSEDFDRMGVDRAYFLTSLKFAVEVDDSGRGQITVTSQDPVLEPYLDFIVEARWPSGRLLREYTVLVDPPAFDQAAPSISASQVLAETDSGQASKKKTEASSGTAVTIDDSDLPAGQMPERAFGSDASPQAVAGDRYMVRRDETLWGIADRSRPEGVSVHQAMLDIQRLNPDAFIDGNINKIKAGYIIYLPAQAEISSDDVEAAVAEVREQNEAWQASRGNEDFRNGPSLRISAEPTAAAEEAAVDSEQTQAAGSVVAMENMERANLERNEMEQRLAALENQLSTLQSIVNLKDEQIAALQRALADGGVAVDEAVAEEAVEQLEATVEDLTVDDLAEAAESESSVEETAELAASDLTGDVAEAVPESQPTAEPEAAAPAPAKKPATPKVVTTPKPAEGGLMDYLWYLVAAVVAVLAGLFVWRRRSAADQSEAPAAPVRENEPAADVFADVELQDQPLELEPEAEAETEVEEVADDELALTAEVTEEDENRGYGQRKHDEYASDVETGDALAEADIYIAYGRYPQAVDLLRNAIANEPNNPAYRLKLLEISAETGDSAEAERQLDELRSLGASDALARAEEVMGAASKGDSMPKMPDLGAELDDLTIDTGEELEADFSGLEIEEEADDLIEDDLDLSADFGESADEESGAEDEELVIATEGNEMSTKLDLARAYLDMGDDDGAKVILEEVINEGSGEQQEEARALLERLG